MKFEVVYKTLNQIKAGDVVLLFNDVRKADWKRWSAEMVEDYRIMDSTSHIPEIIQIVSIASGPAYSLAPTGGRLTLAFNFNYSCQCHECKEARVGWPDRIPEQVISERYLMYPRNVYPVITAVR